MKRLVILAAFIALVVVSPASAQRPATGNVSTSEESAVDKVLRQLRRREGEEQTSVVKGVKISFFWGRKECLGGAEMYAFVPSKDLLADDSFARAVIEEANKYFLSRCGALVHKYGPSLRVGVINPHNDVAFSASYDVVATYNYSPEYRNLGMLSYSNSVSEEVRKTKERERREAQQRAEQARLAKEKADREAARQGRWNDFVHRYGIQEMIDANSLRVNPFVYQGKTVAIHTNFERMVSPDTGLFADGNIMVSGLPRDLFRARNIVVLVGRVTGTTQGVPQLKFIGVHLCKDYGCSDLLAQR